MALTEAQEPYLRLIGLSGRWNAFDGPAIEAALRANETIWRSVVFARAASTLIPKGGATLRNQVDLVVLRDLPIGFVNLDTIFILAEPGRQEQLHALASRWQADEVWWVARDEAFAAMGESSTRNHDYDGDPERVILGAWWD